MRRDSAAVGHHPSVGLAQTPIAGAGRARGEGPALSWLRAPAKDWGARGGAGLAVLSRRPCEELFLGSGNQDAPAPALTPERLVDAAVIPLTSGAAAKPQVDGPVHGRTFIFHYIYEIKDERRNDRRNER